MDAIIALLLSSSAVAVAGLPLTGLQPEDVWRHFGHILDIPRCSGEEAAVAGYIRDVAERRGLHAVEDAARNLIVKRPGGAKSSASAPSVIIQTHLDMVCEKNGDSTHDWKRDPIATTLRDGWLVADETTLGSDNGIGVAMALALMELPGDASLPPLEFVFTVEEETGLFGAERLNVSLLSGRRLLNFDSEEFGNIYIGCAGGGDAIVTLPVDSAPLATSSQAYRLELKGLRGGHSGADIHEYRGNAVVLLARTVFQLQQTLPELRLLDFEGGDKDNAIPRESSAVLGVMIDEIPKVQRALEVIETDLRKEYGRIDPGLSLRLAGEPMQEIVTSPLNEDSANRLVALLLGLPNGVIKKSHETAEFMVETSSNVAKVKRAARDRFEVLCFPRSSIGSALEEVMNRITLTAKLVGATANRTFTFPGWAPNSSQPLLALTVDEFTHAMGSKPQVMTIHAGLECGIIGDKIPGIEMVSFGPDIVGAHAPGERVRVESVMKIWDATRNLLARLASLPSSFPSGNGDALRGEL